MCHSSHPMSHSSFPHVSLLTPHVSPPTSHHVSLLTYHMMSHSSHHVSLLTPYLTPHITPHVTLHMRSDTWGDMWRVKHPETPHVSLLMPLPMSHSSPHASLLISHSSHPMSNFSCLTPQVSLLTHHRFTYHTKSETWGVSLLMGWEVSHGMWEGLGFMSHSLYIKPRVRRGVWGVRHEWDMEWDMTYHTSHSLLFYITHRHV